MNLMGQKKRRPFFLLCLLIAAASSCSKQSPTPPGKPYSSYVYNSQKVANGCKYWLRWMPPNDYETHGPILFDIILSDSDDEKTALQSGQKVVTNVGNLKAEFVSQGSASKYVYVVANKGGLLSVSNPEKLTNCEWPADPNALAAKEAEEKKLEAERLRKEAEKKKADEEAKAEAKRQKELKNQTVQPREGEEVQTRTSAPGGDGPQNTEACTTLLGTMGTGDYFAFGLQSSKEAQAFLKNSSPAQVCVASDVPAFFREKVYDDPVYSVDRDVSADRCDATSFATLEYRPRLDILNKPTGANQKKALVAMRNIAAPKKNAETPIVLRQPYQTGQTNSIPYELYFATDQATFDDGNPPAWASKVYEELIESPEGTTAQTIINQAAVKTGITQAAFVSIGFPSVGSMHVYVPKEDTLINRGESQKNIAVAGRDLEAPLHKLIRSCEGPNKIIVGYFEDFQDEVIKNWPKGYKAGFAILQLHEDQKDHAGMILPSSVMVLNLKYFDQDLDKMGRQVRILTTRLILMTLGASGTWKSGSRSLLANEVFEETIPDDVRLLNFEAGSLESYVLPYAYGNYASTAKSFGEMLGKLTPTMSLPTQDIYKDK